MRHDNRQLLTSSCAREISRLTEQILCFSLFVLILSIPAEGRAGAFVFGQQFSHSVTHATGYTGSGGELVVNVCVVPGTAYEQDMEQAIKNNIAHWNKRQVTSSNVREQFIGSTEADFESVSLHEMGHCIGLAHPNAASESGLSGNNRNFTKANVGANGLLNVDAGADGVIGSADDVRDDDVNRHFFNPLNNNPFSISETVDSSNYTRDVAALPAGDLFPANADRVVSATSRYQAPYSEAVMQQGVFFGEIQRTLAHDDVATLRYAMSGADGVEASVDDYQLRLEYQGITDENCDINVSMSQSTAFATCNLLGAFVNFPSTNNIRISQADMIFNPDILWKFPDPNNPPCSASKQLIAQQWYQFSLPCEVGVSTTATVQAVLGDDLGPNYGDEWILFEYRYVENSLGETIPEYVALDIQDIVHSGVAYWLSTTNVNQVIQVQGEYHSQVDTPLSVDSSSANLTGWNMIGSPFRYPVAWADTRVIAANGDSLSLSESDPATTGGTECTGAIPTDDCKVARVAFSWNAQDEQYDTLDLFGGSLNPFGGAWVFVAEEQLEFRVSMPPLERDTP